MEPLTARLCQPGRWKKQRVRGLNPLSADDKALLETVSRGEFLLNGLRNRDVRQRLFGASDDLATRRRQLAAVSRKLRLLRANGLIRNVPRSHRYLLSGKGRHCITALLAAQAADTAKLNRSA